jgi:outer membrane lipoprotein carrier protein
MQLRRVFAVIPSVLLLSVASIAGAATARRAQGDLLDRAVDAWAKVKTARATFEQTITNPLTGRVLTSNGEYQQERPGRLAVTFQNPANDRVVADGKFVWVYLPSSAPDQVIKTVQGAGGTGTVDLSAQFLSAPRSKYTVGTAGTMIVGGRATHCYTLVPKSAEGAPFKNATVCIDDEDATIRQFEVVDGNGVQRKVRLITFKTNVPVDESAFRFTPPAGVRVISR